MQEDIIDFNPQFIRGQFMIQYQFHTAGDMIRFWALYGPHTGPQT